MLKRISFLGVAVGTVVQIILTNLSVLPFIALATVHAMNNNVPKEELTATVTNELHNNVTFFVATCILGGLCSIIGGYIGARFAKREEILNGTLVSVVYVITNIGSLLMSDPTDLPPISVTIASIFGAIGFCALGGYLRLRQVKRQ